MDSMALYQETLETILNVAGAVQSPETLRAAKANCKNLLVRIFQRALLVRRMMLADTLYRQSQGVIQSGPFAGLVLPEELLGQDKPLTPSLLGTYEEELHPYWNRLICQYIPLIIQVGAAEGYYAVGLARSMPDSYLLVYDASPRARENLEKSVKLNGVTGRVELRAECRRDELNAIIKRYSGAFLLMDCAGAELELLNPEQAPALRQCNFIVECHDLGDRPVSSVLWKRFQESHNLLLVQQNGRDPHALPLLRDLDESSRWLCVDEDRSALKQWLIAETKQPQKGVVRPRLLSSAAPEVKKRSEKREEVAPAWCQMALTDILTSVGAGRSSAMAQTDCTGIMAQIFTHSLRTRLVGFTELVIHFAQSRVQSGPFSGLRLPEGLDPRQEACLAPKLLGTYQEELHPYLARVLECSYPQIVVTGAAEGYYAVGLARGLPNSRFLAFDRSPRAREILAKSAQHNGVADRLTFGGSCTPEGLAAILARQPGSFLLLDGDDGRELLDPQRVPGLLQSDFIVTCRDGGDRSLLSTLMTRFQESHHLTPVWPGGRNPHSFQLLKNLSEHDRWLCVDENRPEGFHWLVAEAKRPLLGMAGGRLISRGGTVPVPVLREEPVARADSSMMTVCYAINGTFVRQMTVSVVSLLLHNDPDRCEVFILCDEEAYRQRGKAQEAFKRFRHRIEFIRIDDVYRHLPSHFSSAAYYRLTLPYAVDRKRIIYLDADTIIEADLTDLWQTDLAGALCAGVQDFAPTSIVDDQARALGLTTPYINSGVLLLDLEGWRREKIAEQVLDFIAKNPVLVRFPDQDSINRILDGRKKLLDPRWNIICYTRDWEERLARAPHQHILHFVTPCRAWAIIGQPPLRKIWQQYEFFTPWRGTPLEKPTHAENWFRAARVAKKYGEFEEAYKIMDELAENLMEILRQKEKESKEKEGKKKHERGP